MEHDIAGAGNTSAESCRRKDQDEGRWRVAILSPSEGAKARELFQDVFGQPMPDALWQWKYGAGRGVNLAAWNGDSLAGHYGGLTRRIQLAGRPALAFQGCDVMVRPAERGVLGRRGALFLLTRAAVEHEVGTGKKHDLLYGFPSARHMRIAERHGLYAPVASMCEFSWPAAGARPSRLLECCEVGADTPALEDAVRILWPQMRACLREAVIVERDAAYLAYRYARHPVFTYRMYQVRRRVLHRPVGLFVIRRDGDRVELMDLVARPGDIARVLPFVRLAASETGASEVFAWACAAQARWFRVSDPREKDLEIAIPSQICIPGIAPQDVRDRWWLMSGDTDFR